MDNIYLAQTDTTVGFLSQNIEKLNIIKNRAKGKQYLKVFSSFASINFRLPQKYKTFIRHSKKTTFIVKNVAFRVVKDPKHSRLIKKYRWLYSTSANKSGCSFDRDFCYTKADIIIEDDRGLHELSSSTIYKINNRRKIKLKRDR